MASTTTNLGLTKPAYTDSADVAVINSNMDILDTKIGAIGSTSVASQIGTLSEQITMNSIGTKSTIAALESALTTIGGAMPNNSVRNIVFAIDPAQGVFKNAGYVGTISRTASGRYTVLAQSHSSVQSGDLVVGVYANSAWTWDNIAKVSELAKVVEYGHMSSSDVADVVAQLISTMTKDGQYVFTFSWSGHSGGAIAQCARCYQGSNTKWNGVITAYDGHTYTFVKNSDSGTTIIDLATKSDISSIQAMLSGIKQTGVSTGIFSLRFTNDQNDHAMALLFSSNPTSDGYKVRLYDVTNSWNIVWQV